MGRRGCHHRQCRRYRSIMIEVGTFSFRIVPFVFDACCWVRVFLSGWGRIGVDLLRYQLF